jgi:HK97 family phage major capsid protein
MAMLLAEAAKLSNDVLLKGVIETILTESQILKKLPFIDIVGNGLTYNQEKTLPGASFHAVNGTWTESTPQFEQKTATLAILGDDADVDEYLRQTRSNVQNLKAIVTDLKSKAVARKFEETFVYGSTTTDPLSFNGLHVLVPTGMKIHAGTTTTPAAGSMRKLKALLRLVMPGGPDALIMSRTTRDNISDYAERSESPVTINGRDDMGKPIMYFGGVPVVCTDWILQTEAIAGADADYSAKTGGTATSIFAVKLGEKLLAGCQNGGIQTKDLGDLETKDATRTRIKWYVSLALFSTLALARYDGITDAAWGA